MPLATVGLSTRTYRPTVGSCAPGFTRDTTETEGGDGGGDKGSDREAELDIDWVDALLSCIGLALDVCTSKSAPSPELVSTQRAVAPGVCTTEAGPQARQRPLAQPSNDCLNGSPNGPPPTVSVPAVSYPVVITDGLPMHPAQVKGVWSSLFYFLNCRT